MSTKYVKVRITPLSYSSRRAQYRIAKLQKVKEFRVRGKIAAVELAKSG